MSFRGFLIRLVVVALTTWIVGAIIESKMPSSVSNATKAR
jgi:hypothetical protein